VAEALAAFEGPGAVIVPGYGHGTMNAAARRHHVLSHTQVAGHQGPPPPPPSLQTNPYGQYEEPSPPYTAVSSNYTTTSEQFEVSPTKRRRLSVFGPGDGGGGRGGQSMPTPPGMAISPTDSDSGRGPKTTTGRGESGGSGGRPAISAPKSSMKRVRTGCLTCRERHLKCDEGVPDCLNCRKSNRECKRGVRLNFIDVQVKDPPYVPPTMEWSGKCSGGISS
jgi:hypothetical protein